MHVFPEHHCPQLPPVRCSFRRVPEQLATLHLAVWAPDRASRNFGNMLLTSAAVVTTRTHRRSRWVASAWYPLLTVPRCASSSSSSSSSSSRALQVEFMDPAQKARVDNGTAAGSSAECAQETECVALVPAVAARVRTPFDFWDESQKMDPYKILGVPFLSEGEAIRRAYVRLVRKEHPDKHGGQQSMDWIMGEWAYRVLSDPEERSKYDTVRVLKNALSLTEGVFAFAVSSAVQIGSWIAGALRDIEQARKDAEGTARQLQRSFMGESLPVGSTTKKLEVAEGKERSRVQKAPKARLVHMEETKKDDGLMEDINSLRTDIAKLREDIKMLSDDALSARSRLHCLPEEKPESGDAAA